jgi:hypothetical protein
MGVLRSALRGAVFLIIVAGVLATMSLFLPSARAAPELTAAVGAGLSAAGAPVDLHLTGELGGSWPAARVVVEVRGPGIPSDGGADWPLAGTIEQDLGDLVGSVDVHVALPPSAFPREGGYRVTAKVSSGDTRQITSITWLGRVSDLPPAIELALVWPVMLGVHRDPEGVFIDDVVQKAVLPDADSAGSLYAFFRLVDQYPKWRMTLAVEPLLLGQVEDLSDGYVQLAADGTKTKVDKQDLSAQQPAHAHDTIRAVAAAESVQVIPTPYASPDLSLVAQQGWTDGFDQIQLGKTEVQSILELRSIPESTYPPGLDVTTDVAGLMGQASIDYALAAGSVAADLVEKPADPSGPVRVRDVKNGRLTLVFADEELRAALVPPWDAGRFAAALAAVLAAGARGPFVASPKGEYGWPPAAYLADIGDLLASAPWISTRTLAEVVANHPPDNRPILLSRYGGRANGFVAQAYVEALDRAHTSALDLEGATDSARAPLDRLRVLLMVAESRYWFVRGVDPRIANVGLSYVRAASDLVAGEFDKVDVAGDKSVVVVGRQGDVPVAIVNRTGYPLDVQLVVSGEGVVFSKAATSSVTLQPQENVFSFPARFLRDSPLVTVRVMAGTTVVDETTIRVRSISAGSVVPWVAGVVLLLVAAVALVRRLR